MLNLWTAGNMEKGYEEEGEKAERGEENEIYFLFSFRFSNKLNSNSNFLKFVISGICLPKDVLLNRIEHECKCCEADLVIYDRF